MHSQIPLKKSVIHLPQEIIEEILSWLPVNSLLRFRCVSKPWLSLIESNRFIKIHYQNSTKHTSLAHHGVILNDLRGISWYSMQSLLNSSSNEGSSSSSSSSCIGVVDPTTDKDGRNEIVGSCYGVVCLSKYSDFWLWNPATKVVVELPKIPLSTIKSGFGWDEASDAFKIFAGGIDTMNEDSYEISDHVYSSKTNSWKRAPASSWPFGLFNSVGVFVCRRIHWAMWLHNEHYAIESFNLENDEFERIEPPPSDAGWRDMWLGEIGPGGCLCTLFYDYKMDRVDFWVMKEYGVTDSWFKRITFPRHVCFFRGFRDPPLVGRVLKREEIFIICENTFMVYSSNAKDEVLSKVIANFNCSNGGFLCFQSLVSPLNFLGSTR